MALNILKAELTCAIKNVELIARKCSEDTRYAVPEIAEAFRIGLDNLRDARIELALRAGNE